MSTTTVPEPSRTVVRKAALTGFIGTMVEAYDFFTFTYLIVFISPLFFPSEDPTTGILKTLLVLGSGFVTRPLGGIIFGRMGDRVGRRHTLIVTITGMGCATLAMSMLPTYSSVGVVAPILLILVRLLQGLMAGGELMGSATFVSEHASQKNHGFLSSMTPMGFAFGAAVAPLVVAMVTELSSESFMASWGWRIPLVMSVPLMLIALYLRTKLEDSPEFRHLADLQKVRKSPVIDLFRSRYTTTLIKGIAISAAVLALGYIVSAYLPLFIQQVTDIGPGTTAGFASVAAFIALPVGFATGLFIDRFGRKRMQILLFSLMLLLIFPGMYLIEASGGAFIVVAFVQCVFLSMGGAVAVPAYAALTAMFPPSVRYTGAALAFGIGSAIGGGIGPYLAGKFAKVTGSPYASGGVVIFWALIGIVAAITISNRMFAGEPKDDRDASPGTEAVN